MHFYDLKFSYLNDHMRNPKRKLTGLDLLMNHLFIETCDCNILILKVDEKIILKSMGRDIGHVQDYRHAWR